MSKCLKCYFFLVLGTSEGKDDKQKTTVEWVCLILWRIIGILTLPYFWWKGHVDDWMNPKDPKFLVTNYVLSVLLPLVDCITDFVTGANYLKPLDGKAKDPWYGRITIGVPFLPFLVKSAIAGINTAQFMLNHFKLFFEMKKTILMEPK